MRVLGIDPSLTSTGLAIVTDTGVAHTDVVAPKPTRRGLDRMRYLRSRVMEWATNVPVDLVVMEGPSFGSVGSGQHERGGLWWLLLHTLDSHDLAVAIVPPSNRAKYAAGSGNAKKDVVLGNVVRRYTDTRVGITNDEADAVILAAMGVRHLGHPIDDPMPKVNLAAMALPAQDPAKGQLTGWPLLPSDQGSEIISA